MEAEATRAAPFLPHELPDLALTDGRSETYVPLERSSRLCVIAGEAERARN